MKLLVPLVALAVVLCGCATSDPSGSAPVAMTPTKTVGDYQLGQPITAGNVTLIPVSLTKSAAEPTQDNTMTLAEAKKLGLVEIIEMPEGQEVNTLKVRNLGDRPLLLLGGELLLGGKQDRIVAKDVLVPAGKTMNVSVFCVEHGRWDGPSTRFNYSETMVPSKVREAATYGQQQDVWDSVGKYNVAAGRSDTKSTTVAAGLSSPEVQAAIKDKLPDIERAMAADPKVVGVIFVLNGKIQTLDLFGNPRLFSAAHSGLLKGYLAQAATEPDTKKSASIDECAKFLDTAVNSKSDVTLKDDSGVLPINGEGIRGMRMDAKAAGGVVAPLHGSYSPR